MKWWFMGLALFLLVWLQLILGNLGVAVPLAAMGVAYFTVAYGWQYGGCGALLVGGALAAIYATPGYLLVMLATVPAVEWWFRHHAEDVLGWNWQMGMILALATAVLVWAGRADTVGMTRVWSWTEEAFLVLQLLGSVLLSGFLCPVVILTGEAAAELLGLPRFRAALERKP